MDYETAFACTFCNRPVDPRQAGSMRRSIGWINAEGTPGRLLLPEPAAGWAHRICVEMAGRGHSPGQADLFA